MRKSIFLFLIIGCADFLPAAVLNVPSEYATIDSAITAAMEGDTVLIAPGTYNQTSLTVPKPLVIASNYINSGDETDIDSTIIKATPSATSEWFDLTLNATNSKVIGFTVVGSSVHSLAIRNAYSEVIHCKFIGGTDQVSFESGGGYVGYCYFEGSGDDAIDLDFSVDWIIEHCTIVNSGQDAVEVRLHVKSGPLTKHIFRYNTIINSAQSGIQMIDYPEDSFREFEIYGNVFKDCQGSGVSFMDNGATNEAYQGSKMVEKATVYNNTFDGCNYGMTMGANVIVLNNIFSNSGTKGIERGIHLTSLNDSSIMDFCDFYNNPTDFSVDLSMGSNIFTFDPQYSNTTSYELSAGSQAVDKGVAIYDRNGNQVLNIPVTDYSGGAPDLGAKELVTVGITQYNTPPVEPGMVYSLKPGDKITEIFDISGKKMVGAKLAKLPGGFYIVKIKSPLRKFKRVVVFK